MAINQSVMGPNSSTFTWDAPETTANVMAAMDAYITSKGWELYDSEAPQAIGGTSPVGRVYRALQEGSTTVFKYVGIAINTTSMKFRCYGGWDLATHTGSRETFYVGGFSSTGNATIQTLQVGTAGASVLLFVNPKWLGFRTKSSTNVLGQFQGSFEIMKEYGEDASISTNCFMTTESSNSGPYSTNAFVSVCQGVSDPNAAANIATGRSTFSTLNAGYFAGYDGISIGAVNPSFSGAATMTAIEATSDKILLARGRIIGVKHAFGPAFTDMDTASILCNDKYMHDNQGTAVSHHYLSTGSMSFYLPA